MSGLTKAELQAELDKAAETIRGLEALADYGLAEHHPRWSAAGELLLIGDVGSDRDGSEGQVAEIIASVETDGEWIVRTVDGRIWRHADCYALVTRARLPRPRS